MPNSDPTFCNLNPCFRVEKKKKNPFGRLATLKQYQVSVDEDVFRKSYKTQVKWNLFSFFLTEGKRVIRIEGEVDIQLREAEYQWWDSLEERVTLPFHQPVVTSHHISGYFCTNKIYKTLA